MIITGCQRSGTQSIALAFGLKHEKYFTPHRVKVDDEEVKNIFEVSWMAQPWVVQGYFNVPIIHLVRHPFNVLRSILGIRFFDYKEEEHTTYRDFIFHHLKDFPRLEDQITQALYYIINWNKPLEKYPRIRVEDIYNLLRANQRHRSNITIQDISSNMLFGEFEQLCKRYKYGLPNIR